MTKECNKCFDVLPIERFAKTKSTSSKDGYLKTCKSCVNKNSKRLRELNAPPKVEKILVDKKTRAREYMKKARQSKEFRLKQGTRSLIYNSFKRALKGSYRKSDKTENILGCGLNYFIKYLSKNFQDGMTLDNYGQWHIDHKKPLALAKTEKDILSLCHYTNLQPMWAIDNMKKGAKWQ